MQRIAERLIAGKAVVAGVLSGTSGDGIDVALVDFPDASASLLGAARLRAFATLPFPGDLRARVRAVLDRGELSLSGSALLSRDLGRAFGLAARELAQGSALELDLVAS